MNLRGGPAARIAPKDSRATDGGRPHRGRGRWVALTGTPGTGKSTVARLLPRSFEPIEVADLALELRAGRRTERGDTRVDLGLLRDRFVSPGVPIRVLVGHLAHLLPVRDTLILRCRPSELDRRLTRSRRGTPRERLENVVSEAIDLILIEARQHRRRIWELDATDRSPGEVAREVTRIIRERPPPRWGSFDWLSDPSTTEYLLRRRP
ncbi:MAG TPA: AAA family ATPase [Thermoplasmata archaeon]|nr:AAA family ATPase [Thermoplasmata archaeon]